jgi:hypothetical protein
MDLEGLVELGALELLEQADGLMRRVFARGVHAGAGVLVALAVLGHQAPTSTPIERAVPSMIFDA